ncbi:hypothetical protein [Pedobacter glucosidilyticus]|uniref:hypothetical protein n=1 Tax=Pedobacter glucosidilyticus TaxID=1122941 RepID=UPI000418042C|nr:hypothetical protein [Pedobacter glucosidilyticus]
MAKDWTSIEQSTPNVGKSVIASVKDGNSFYSEFLILQKDRTWNYQNGRKLEDSKKVVGWMDSPSTYLG